MKNVLNNKPSCIDNMGSEIFVETPLYKNENDYSVLYINEKLYEKIFNKKFVFNEASKNIKDLFSVTINDNGKEIIGKAYIDKQGDPTGISLNENKGSGRAYYVGDKFNIKGEKTVLCTSSLDEYNNGKYSLEAAFQETMISEVINELFDINSFKVLAIFDTKEKYKFPKSSFPLECSLLIRYYESNELYRFSHRFINNKKFSEIEIKEICKKMGIIEGNKIIHRFLHGAWSIGNLSIDCNMIDFDTSFFVNGRCPSWIFSVAHKENYFGYEDEGEKRIIDILFDNKMIDSNVKKEELYSIIDKEKYNSILKGFLYLNSYDLDIYLKHKNEIEELVNLFIELYPKMVYNYDKMNCSNILFEKNYLFDFSRFFRFYNLYKYKNKEDLFKLLFNERLEVFNYHYFDKEHYKAVYDYFKKDIVDIDYDDVIIKAKLFITKFDEFNINIDKEIKNSIIDKIKTSYLRNESKRYLMAIPWLRGGLCKLKDKYSPKVINYLINFVINYYTQKDINDFKTNLIIFKEGIFYKQVINNSYKYIFRFYNSKEYDIINLNISNTNIMLFNIDNYEYKSEIIDNINFEDIKYISLNDNSNIIELNIIDYEIS